METAQNTQQDGLTHIDFVKARFWQALKVPGVLILLSWGVISFAFLTGRNVLIDHDYLLRTSRLPWGIALIIFLVCWQVMILAMMGPSLLSRLIVLYDTHEKQRRTQALFLVSYACVWTLFALLAFVGDTLLHEVVRSWWWLYLHAQLIGPCVLALAGLVQWSPMKQRCLACSKTNMNRQIFLPRQNMLRSSWQEGWCYGYWCVGSNWALMLLMFALGMKSLLILALLTTFMFIERELSTTTWFRLLSGGTLFILALLWYIFPFIG